MPPTLPGPGDPETWGPPMGHPSDPRTEDVYGACDVCEEETNQVLDWGSDEEGRWISFRCEGCERLVSDMEEEPVEMARRYRLREHWIDDLSKQVDRVHHDAQGSEGEMTGSFAIGLLVGTARRIQEARERGH